MKKYCYIDGKIIEEKDASISLYDLGILRGYGVFDFMCTTNNKPFLIYEHWLRLNRSARALGLQVPITKQKYEQIIIKLITKNPYKNPAIRSVLTAGVSENGITLPSKSTFYILIHDITKLLPPRTLYKKGAKLITHEFARDNYTSKTTNYIEAIKKQKEKNHHNAVEVLYFSKNTILECTTANVFMVKNKKLLTPKNGILPGITRRLVLKLAKKHNIHVAEQKITKKQLLNADEVFITGSAKDILPITIIDTITIGIGKPGPITERISKLYSNYLNNY